MAKAGVKRVVIDVSENLSVPPSELEEMLRVELALRLHEKGVASLGQAWRLAGSSKWGFLELLAREGIPSTLLGRGAERRLGGCQETCGESEKAVTLEIRI